MNYLDSRWKPALWHKLFKQSVKLFYFYPFYCKLVYSMWMLTREILRNKMVTNVYDSSTPVHMSKMDWKGNVSRKIDCWTAFTVSLKALLNLMTYFSNTPVHTFHYIPVSLISLGSLGDSLSNQTSNYYNAVSTLAGQLGINSQCT